MKKNICLLLCVVAGWVGAETLTSGGDFLKLPAGGRNAAMGEASVAAVNDIEAINVNPAGLAHIRGLQFAFEHQEWFQSVRFDSFSVAMPLDMLFPRRGLPGILGVTAQYLYMTPIEIYDSWSMPVDSIKFSAFQIRVGYALQLFESDLFKIRVGGNASFISKSMSAQELDVKGQSKPAVDLSAQAIIYHRSPDLRKVIGDSFTAGLVFRNIDFYSTGPNENWPLLIKGGFAAKIYDLVLVDIDLAKDLTSPFAATIGAEYWLRDLVAFRAGGKLQASQSGHFSLGVGFKYKLRDYTMYLDYALLQGLDYTHKFAFKMDISKLPVASDDILYYRGVDHFVKGEYPQAIRMWERVLQRQPDHSEAKKRIEETQRIIKLNEDEQKLQEQINSGGMFQMDDAAPTPDTAGRRKKVK